MTHPRDPSNQVPCWDQKQSVKKRTAKSKTDGAEGFTEETELPPLQ